MEKTKPTMKVSDEATQEQLEMAQAQGQVMGKALHHMIGEVASDGQEKVTGPYLVSYAIEQAEGMYFLKNGDLVWQEPEAENIHVEVAVRDAADGRFIPYLNIHVRLIDSQNNDVGYHQQPFVWHPWLYHYGRNWHVPEDGDYRLEIDIKTPDFPRHDKKNGQRYGEDVEVVFAPVKIETE